MAGRERAALQRGGPGEGAELGIDGARAGIEGVVVHPAAPEDLEGARVEVVPLRVVELLADRGEELPLLGRHPVVPVGVRLGPRGGGEEGKSTARGISNVEAHYRAVTSVTPAYAEPGLQPPKDP